MLSPLEPIWQSGGCVLDVQDAAMRRIHGYWRRVEYQRPHHDDVSGGHEAVHRGAIGKRNLDFTVRQPSQQMRARDDSKRSVVRSTWVEMQA
jgi:hypothetical protein